MPGLGLNQELAPPDQTGAAEHLAQALTPGLGVLNAAHTLKQEGEPIRTQPSECIPGVSLGANLGAQPAGGRLAGC